MVSGRISNRDPLAVVDTNAGAPSGVNRSELGEDEVYLPGAPWDKRVVGIGYCPLPEA